RPFPLIQKSIGKQYTISSDFGSHFWRAKSKGLQAVSGGKGKGGPALSECLPARQPIGSQDHASRIPPCHLFDLNLREGMKGYQNAW
ncbi:hypothetical protein BO99DRAFT_347631, partial [Aspergillus violaceofuscus CBS 115571]